MDPLKGRKSLKNGLLKNGECLLRDLVDVFFLILWSDDDMLIPPEGFRRTKRLGISFKGDRGRRAQLTIPAKSADLKASPCQMSRQSSLDSTDDLLTCLLFLLCNPLPPLYAAPDLISVNSMSLMPALEKFL